MIKLTIQEKQEALELLRSMIKTNTVNPPGNEKELAVKLAALMNSEGIEAETVEVLPGRDNLIVRMAGENHGKLLAATGHLDTVPPGGIPWEHDPFAADVVDGKLYGRGTSDMKSGDAAFLYAMIKLKREGIVPKQDVIFIGTVSEENGSLGAKAFVEAGGMKNVDALLVCEPSSNELDIAHKGAVWVKVKFYGKTAHGSMPDLGVNAVSRAAKFIAAIDAQSFDVKPDDILDMPSCSVNICQGGVATNVVPDYCEVTIDFRTIPGQTAEEIKTYLNKALDSAAKDDKDFKAEIEILSDLSAVRCPEGASILDALDKAAGRKHIRRGVRFYTDASTLVRDYPEKQVVIYGPGISEMAHQPNEYCEVEQFERFVETYANLLKDYEI
ncbi:MAG: M20 family metallopeptidase [Schwartzia sp.]|nr:M20 family metallopeptidase [Schwartzia sp. (in: firmicutes)]